MKNILEFLRRASKASAAELRGALEQAATESAGVEAELGRLERARRSLLLEGTDAELEKHDHAIGSARRARDRAITAKAELEQQLAAAIDREAVAALDAERDAAEREAQAVAKALATDYPKLARGLVSLLKRLEAAEEEVKRVNRKLADAGREERLKTVETRALPHPTDYFLPQHTSLLSRVALPSLGSIAPGWNCEGQSVMFDEKAVYG
jgi:chromosome segregation ATPase